MKTSVFWFCFSFCEELPLVYFVCIILLWSEQMASIGSTVISVWPEFCLLKCLMIVQLPILFLLTGSDPMSQLQQPVRILQCEAKKQMFLLCACNFRQSYLQVISSHANCTIYWSLKDMAINAHTHLLIGQMFDYLEFKSILYFFLMEFWSISLNFDFLLKCKFSESVKILANSSCHFFLSFYYTLLDNKTI